jgi:hypothetical protein
MGFIAQDSGGGDFKRVPPGVFIGRCYSVIDLGTQEVEFQGDKKLQRKVQIRWELFGEEEDGTPLTVEKDGQTMPLTISKRYTLSLSDKARLRADLAAWRGRDFNPDELKGFDISKLIGAYCMVNVTHNETNGKTYSNIASLTPLPSAMKAHKPAGVHEAVMFDLDSPDMAVLDGFHEKLQETIKGSVEWRSRGQSKPTQTTAGGKTGFDDMDDDIPFIVNTLTTNLRPGKDRRLDRCKF